jgi:hypothetical protein
MTAIRFLALPTDKVRALQAGGPDAYGNAPERRVSDGSGIPCRHCLTEVPEGEPYLILAWRPFGKLQPYAETGPIFLCANPCERHPESAETPAMFLDWERLLIRGYSEDERIVYGTGEVVETADVAGKAAGILARPEIAFVDLRSVRNNCFQARIVRG